MAYSIGVDIGTTKVAVVVTDSKRNLLACVNASHHADLKTIVPGAAEQDVQTIFHCIFSLLEQLPADLRNQAEKLCVTGQMHSVTLQKPDGTFLPLVTWQDTRCGADFLQKTNEKSGLHLCEGFGGTTLARMAANNELQKDWRAATIVDAFSATMLGSRDIVTDPTFAASWGIYNFTSKSWNAHALEVLGIPVETLPQIQESGCILGTVSVEIAKKYGLSKTLKVCNSVGDNQASILGTGEHFEQEIFLTIGTGAQLSVVCDRIPEKLAPGLDLRPFPGNKILLVNAPLCGGSSFAMLADTILKFQADFGGPQQSKKEVLDKLDTLALTELQAHGIPAITVAPHFCGERYNPALRGSISGLDLQNCTPAALAAAFAVGVINNLKKAFDNMDLTKRTKIICSGNGVRLMKSVQYAIKLLFGVSPTLSDRREEAAQGACVCADITND